jgi:F-type H+-transporting ATPase subunit delta
MARRGYARRYGQAVFDIALEKKEVDRWQSDLSKIASLAEDATVAAWLENPKVHFDLKARLLSEQLGDINPLALNLAYLLIARGRLGMAGDIADEYQYLLDRHRGLERAEVTTAIPLDDEEKKHLAEGLAGLVSKEVVLKATVDPSVIGGFVARIGDKMLDASTRHRLDALKEQMAGSR